MRVQVNDVRLFFDVDGAKLVPDGAILRDRPTLLLLHGGPGFDHSLFKPQFSELANIAQVIYLDLRGNGRSDHGSRDRGHCNNGLKMFGSSVRFWKLSDPSYWECRLVAL